MEQINVLSLFDGMSCGQIALERAGIPVKNYFASEVDKYAIRVAMANYPNTIQLGDVTKWMEWDLPKIDLLIGGSPCQGFSRAGKGLNFDDPRSKLFFEYVNILGSLKKKNPEIKFLLENVKMKKKWQDIISEYLGVEPIMIDSALVSVQSRKRLYWANWKFQCPEDRNILLKNILEDNVNDKFYLSEKQLKYVVNNKRLKKKFTSINGEKALNLMADYDRLQGTHIYTANIGIIGLSKKTGTLQARYYKGMEHFGTNPFIFEIIKNKGKVRKLTPTECERLQTVPDNYTKFVSNSQRYKMLGNGWTVDVIAHIFKGINE